MFNVGVLIEGSLKDGSSKIDIVIEVVVLSLDHGLVRWSMEKNNLMFPLH